MNNGSTFTEDDVINDCNIDWLLLEVGVVLFDKNGFGFEDILGVGVGLVVVIGVNVVVLVVVLDKLLNNWVDYFDVDVNRLFNVDIFDYYYFYDTFLIDYKSVGDVTFASF